MQKLVLLILKRASSGRFFRLSATKTLPLVYTAAIGGASHLQAARLIANNCRYLLRLNEQLKVTKWEWVHPRKKGKTNPNMAPKTSKQFQEIREQSQHKIIVAALKLFSELGYKNTSIAAITKEAGVSKGLFYNYFETKEAVIKAVLDHLMQMGDAIMQQSHNQQTPKEQLASLLNQTFDFLEHQSQLNRLIIPLALDKDNFQYINSIYHKKAQFYLGQLQQLFTDLNYENPTAEAWILGLILDGLSLDYSVVGEELPIETIKKSLFEKYQLL